MEARRGEISVVLGQVPPGRSHVQVFRDGNANGALDRQFMGSPIERCWFSNNPLTLPALSTFGQAALTPDPTAKLGSNFFYCTF